MIVSGEEEQMPKWSEYALILGSHVYLTECDWQYDQSEGVFMANGYSKGTHCGGKSCNCLPVML